MERVLSRLPQAKLRPSGGWSAKCPAHNGQGDTSLSIDEGDDSCVLLHCFAACSVDAILKALGLTIADLFPDREGGGGYHMHPKTLSNTRTPDDNRRKTKDFDAEQGPQPDKGFESSASNTPPLGLTLQQYAKAKKTPVKTLLDFGLSDVTINGTPAVRIPYRDAEGAEPAIRFRLALEGDHKFRWRTGSKPCLYGLWRLDRAKAARYIVIVEGESDCHTLWHHDIAAIGLPGANTWREERDAPLLDGISRIYINIEPDRGGNAIRQWLSRSHIRERVCLLDLGEYKDPSALYLADPEHFLERWQAAMDAAVPWTVQAEAERQQAGRTFYALAKDLLEAPDLLNCIGETMQALGYAGDVTPPKLAYVGMTSRLLERPQNLAFIAPSGAGKNRAVDSALELMPEDAYYLEKAGSARALIYSDGDFQYRVLVVAEADSIPEDGPAASAIRSIAADNYMAYDVVEKNPKTGQFETRRIIKPGPTGLITTSTKSLGTQMGTRVLEIPIRDDAEQTREVLKAHARSVASTNHQGVDLTPYVALQRYLAAQGERRVIVPFAELLANLVPAQAVRMRRDFRQLLTCIQAIALLYQCQREHTPDGAIMSTLKDYRLARELLAPIFDSIVAEGITSAVRSTVEAVQPDEEITETVLAQRFQLSKATVHYRVSRALAGGWLVNHETRKGYPAKLTPGAPLPDVKGVLPTPEEVAAKVRERGDGANGSIRTLSSHKPFEQPLSVSPTGKNAEVFECSNDQRGKRETPPPLSEEEIIEWTA